MERNRNCSFTQRCFCGENAILRTSRSRANLGKKIFGCRKYGGDEVDCGYLMWFDTLLSDTNNWGMINKRNKDVEEIHGRNRVDEEIYDIDYVAGNPWKKMILCFMIGLLCGLFLKSG
ncbi:hypothetical protein M5689_011169 [Euphorbia peplus]|nr:hypothetical protein M5689_011169 [Euphorbia peplus]